MKSRGSISVKILLLAFLNLVLLALVFGVFARLQFRLDPGSFLLAPARDRILSVSRLIALEFPDTRPEAWNQLLARNAQTYPARFFIFTNEGRQIAGDPVTLPASLLDWIRGDHMDFFDKPDHAPASPSKVDFPPGPPFFLLRSGSPSVYWAGVHVPIRNAALPRHLRCTLVWNFSSLWANPFFFNYTPWLAVLIAIVFASLACWVPLVRDLTRSISQLTNATGRIAEGQFDIDLPTNRRDELGRLSDSIHQMAAKLSDFVHGQRRFLSDVAHELCSPIARIQVALGILEQRTQPNLQPYVADLKEEVEHMSELVNELLAFSKTQINTEHRAIERVNVAEIVDKVLQREAPGNIRFTINIDGAICAAAFPDYLYRSLANLVRNAVRYAGDAGPISISAATEQGAVSISIADQGPGLPDSELERVFKPFYRPELARQRETGGTGLGLAIVRSCIEACGGTVRCRNMQPHGLEVEIRLPSAPAAVSGQTAGVSVPA
ncbi:MAG: HAMP domain-containing sensor histidine kinase [Bryobacteraceae bacterium]